MTTDSAVSKPVDRATESSLQPVTTEVPPPGRSRRRRIEAAIAAAVTLAGGVGIFLATRRGGEREAGATMSAASAAPATRSGAEAQRETGTGPAGKAGRKPGEVALAPGVTAHNKIEVVPVRRAALAGDIHVIGNVSFNADHVAIVGPLVAGRIARLGAGIGSRVERGQVIAEVESADVGDARISMVSGGKRPPRGFGRPRHRSLL